VRYGEHINFNAQNAKDYLFELDQYIAKLLIYEKSKQTDEPLPELAMLDMNQIMPKELV
jgi:hypothetical protein